MTGLGYRAREEGWREFSDGVYAMVEELAGVLVGLEFEGVVEVEGLGRDVVVFRTAVEAVQRCLRGPGVGGWAEAMGVFRADAVLGAMVMGCEC